MLENEERTASAVADDQWNTQLIEALEANQAPEENIPDVDVSEPEDSESFEVVAQEENTQVEEEPVLPMTPKAPEKKKKDKNPRKPIAIVGIICGAIILIMGLYALSGGLYVGPTGNSTDSTIHTSYSWYGGDAYSGIQQAGADASNNAAIAADNVALANSYLGSLMYMVSKATGMLLIAFGLMTICGSLYGLVSVKKKEDAEADMQQ